MINYKQIDESYFNIYDSVQMVVHVKSHYVLNKINNGLGGFLMQEIPVEEYIKDLGVYERASEYANTFDISNWAFYMAFDDEIPIGAVTIASRTNNVNMLDDRDDLSVLWDIRVVDDYKRRGVGQHLFDLVVDWSRKHGLKQIKIECQNNNVPACKFYHKQGAVLSKIDEYAYYNDESAREEIQLIWYINL